MSQKTTFAEVIESSLSNWTAQCWQWNQGPSYGSMVTIQGKKRTLFGIVHQVQTGSMDPVRYPFPYQKTEEELLAEQPQIFEFLKTTFSCLTIGYQEKGKMYYLLAPEPPAIHAFVAPMTLDMSKEFFYSASYLHLLFGFANQIPNLDELLLAIFKHQVESKILTERKIQSFIDTFSLLTGNDYRRLKLFLQRADHIIESAL